MSKQILIELVGENETGYCYADVYLPASAEEIAEAKERANWNSASNGIRDISIEHCSALPKLASFRLDSGILRNGTVFTEAYAFSHGGLTNLLFPFQDGVDIDIGRLAVWRLATHDQFGGTWLSDYIPNRLEDTEAYESQDICQQCEM